MEGNIFGSVLDLNALLGDGDSAFGIEVEGLDDLEGFGDLPRDFPGKASSDTSHLTGMGYEASNDEEDQFAKASSTSQVWGLQGSSPAPFKQTTEGNPDTAALLTQLLSVIQRNASPKTDPAPCNPPPQTNASPSGLVPSPTGNLTLPNLTAQQQQTLSTIMSIGTVGTTPEGKKVRRMLSNRESARRSRHRKQAHMHNLEEKVHAVEAENNCLKLALAKASEMELQHTTERLQLQAEVAMLRAKISQMEHAGSCGTGIKSALHCSHTNTKAESLSFGSCCASIPNQSHLEFEQSSKKRRLTTNQASPV